MFSVGDIIQTKAEFLNDDETQESTMGIVVGYNPDNDYLEVGVLNPEDYFIPPVSCCRGRFYEKVNVHA